MENISFKPSLKEAFDTVSQLQGRQILVVKIENCDSCEALCSDLPLIVSSSGSDGAIVGRLNIESTLDVHVMGKLILTEVPAVYALLDGNIVGGWFGYDYDQEPEIRIEALAKLIMGKYQALC